MPYSTAVILAIIAIEGGTGYINRFDSSSLAGSYSDVNINGKNYLLNTYGFSLTDAVNFCKFKNMALISLDEAYEYSEWVTYIESLGLAQMMFWTSAWKIAGSSQWKWNSTNQNFEESSQFWAPNEPSTPPEARGCMSFRADTGWDDWVEKNCTNFRLIFNTICE